jgi:uncharacterized protein YbjQ (UPF0145 family)
MTVCPACGCEQREAAKCVQCQTPLRSGAEIEAEKILTEKGASISRPNPYFMEAKEAKKEKPVKLKKEPESEPAETAEDLPPKPIRQGQVRTVEPGRRSITEEGAQKVLITTTQKIEGKKISTYFGMINANIIVELDDQLSSIPDKKVFSMNAHYRSHLKSGMLMALRDLREEAALLGANAVIATTLNFQRMDPRSLLLSAIGTAVLIESKESKR